jgi:TonB-linked SusC/RagA family outer membrane protein
MSQLSRSLPLLLWAALLSQSAYAQSTISGIISGTGGITLPGATAAIVGTNNYSVADKDGRFVLNAKPGDLLHFSFVGYEDFELVLRNETELNVSLTETTTMLDEVVVVGYGTQQKKDLTGSVSSVQEKDFNKGNFISPDQLLQGRVAGVQITNSSGQPGVASTIKIRGNSVLNGTGQPLFVVDGVPLSGTSARPNISDQIFFTSSPSANPLNFLNPSDIVSMDVLKDASAAAIYGSRAAYGVVIITTKKGQSGEPRIDFAFSTGLSSIQNKVKVLNAAQYREAIQYYEVNASNDKGTDTDALESILRTGKQQNYSLGISGGNSNANYRLSFGYLDQEGIIAKSEIKKFNGNLSGTFKFLESKRLGVDINLTASQYQEEIPLIRNEGSIVGDALTWNPTDSLWNNDSTFNIVPGGNPIAVSEKYHDNTKVTTVLASISPYYEFTDWLEFRMLGSINYGTGIRRTSMEQGLFVDSDARYGTAGIYNNENYTSQITSTFHFHKDILPQLHLTATAGFEYMKFTNKGSSIGVIGPSNGFGNFGLDYTDYIQYSNPANRQVSSFTDPLTELQSYFGRVVLNYKRKYILTATFRADGSTKFGKDNKYGYFPSYSAAWIVSEEDFLSTDFIDYLKIRLGWGKTGNQEFPGGSSVALYNFTNNGGYGQINNPNPNLKWQADEQFNAGIDFTILKNRISGTLDYFHKITTDLLYPSYPIQPAPPGSVVTWINLDGKILNSGLEASINASIINDDNVAWDFGVNATFVSNDVSGLKSPILTGYLTGGGMSGVTVQQIKNDAPMNTFYTRKFLGIDPDTGLSIYEDNGEFYNVGNPNPTTLLGINTTFTFKKLSFTTNLYGAFGHSIYNNTLNSTISVGNIRAGKNIALSVFQEPVKESLANPVTASSRYIESGDYLKMGNATIAYNIGSIGKAFKQSRLYVTAQNVFTITNYSGFNPEVNIDRSVKGVPSLGIDNHTYPTARTIIVGMSFSL